MEQRKNRKKKKRLTPAERAWNTIKNVLVIAVAVAAVAMMIFTVVSVSTFDRNDRSLFGYKAFIVRSDSMSATDFASGDLILVKEVDPSTLEVGDIISYQSTATDNYGETITHKIRTKTTNDSGQPCFVTYGTTTGIDDSIPVAYEYVQGKYMGHIPGLGKFFAFLRTPPGYVCCILVPFAILIIAQGISTMKLYKKYKKQQLRQLKRQWEREHAEKLETKAGEEV